MSDGSSVSHWILVAVFGSMALVATAVEAFVLWSAVTGYWGSEWPTVGRDLAIVSGIWLVAVLPVLGLVLGPRTSDGEPV